MNCLFRCFGNVLCLALAAAALPSALTAQTAPTGDADSSILQLHLGRGYEALKEEKYDIAETEFRAALAIDSKLDMRARFPLAVALYQQHKNGESREQLETLRKSVGEQTGISYYLGRIDLDERNYPAAITNLAKASAQPPFPDTAFFLGLAYSKQGEDKDAEKWLRQATELDPGDSRAEYQLATLYRKQGRDAEANAAFQRAKDIKANSEQRSQWKFECNKDLDRSAAGQSSACERLNNPNDAELLTTLGVLYGQHGQLEKAIPPLKRAAELSPQSPQMQYNLAFTYYRLNQFDEARLALESAVHRWPDLFPVNALYGASLLELGQTESAYESLHHAHQLNPKDASVTNLLYRASLATADQRESSGSSQDAIRILGAAAELLPSESEPHRRLAGVYRKIGDLGLAREEQAKADKLSRPTSQ